MIRAVRAARIARINTVEAYVLNNGNNVMVLRGGDRIPVPEKGFRVSGAAVDAAAHPNLYHRGKVVDDVVAPVLAPRPLKGRSRLRFPELKLFRIGTGYAKADFHDLPSHFSLHP